MQARERERERERERYYDESASNEGLDLIAVGRHLHAYELKASYTSSLRPHTLVA